MLDDVGLLSLKTVPLRSELYPRRTRAAALAALGLALAVPARGGQLPGNFQTFHPPVLKNYFGKAGLNHVEWPFGPQWVTGDGFRYAGASSNVNFRHSIDKDWAWDMHFDMYIGAGKATGVRISGQTPSVLAMSFGLGAGAQYKLYDSEKFFVIGSGGVYVPYSYQDLSGVRKTKGGGYATLGKVSNVLYGIPLGLNAAIDLGPKWRLSPFLSYIQYVGGSASSYSSDAGLTAPPANPGAFGALTYGVDIGHIPLGLYLGPVWQRTPTANGNPAYDAFLFQFTITLSRWLFGARSFN